MWEERSCSQVRQWQHWGSGCYNYLCEQRRLHIVILNHTYTCYFPGQEIQVSITENLLLKHDSSRCCSYRFASDQSWTPGSTPEVLCVPRVRRCVETRLQSQAARAPRTGLLLTLTSIIRTSWRVAARHCSTGHPWSRVSWSSHSAWAETLPRNCI